MVGALEEVVAVPAGSYRLGEPGEERVVWLAGVLIGRWPVTNSAFARFATATGHAAGSAKLAQPALADHPVTDVTLADANAFCAWASAELAARVRLPSGDEWEALARGTDARPWPWGAAFDAARCNCAEAAWGWTVPVDAHPAGASPFGAEGLAGNVWEWVADREAGDGAGWGVVRGGCYLDWAWGLRASRALPADPGRATATTGLRIAVQPAGRPDGARPNERAGRDDREGR